MKTKILLFHLLLAFMIYSTVTAQYLNLSVTGHVFDIGTGMAVNNHEINVGITENGIWNNYIFFSDSAGSWGSDSLSGFSQGIIYAFTYDCNGQIHEYQENYFSGSTTFVFDFNICQDSITGEDCENWFLYEQTGETSVHFHGESLPYPATEYFWNFGDGQTGTGQDIIHTYTLQSGNTYLVQLTSIVINSPMGDSCIAYSGQWITLLNSQLCEADFYYISDSVEPGLLQFFDNSTGNITGWYWDFGDGTSSSEINPVHTFNSPDTFTVCLTITADSLGTYCTDTHCKEIIIGAGLTAGFSIVLDTSSQEPRKYLFIDLSAGNAQTWQWNFGDGGSSNQQNPVYQFSKSGLYEVCLLVTAPLPNGGMLSDTLCKELTVPNYYDIGGLAFIGNTPINNPSSTGDTGIACLYRKYNDLIVAVDTNYFYEYGYFWFTDVREGNYILKAGLTESSHNFSNFGPAYYEHKIFWQQANTLQLEDSNNYYVNVYLTELLGTPAGSGSISGNVVDMQNPSMSDYVFDQPVFLYNDTGDLLSCELTNVMGSFTFENLAFGTYQLITDVTGFSGEPLTITLDPVNPVYYNALLVVAEGWSIGIEENIISGLQIGSVYPNPVTDNVNTDVISSIDAILMTGIYNIFGQKMSEHLYSIQPGRNIISASAQKLEKGLYFFSVASDTGRLIKTFKFLKK